MTGRSDPVYAGFKAWLREHVLPGDEQSWAIAFRSGGRSEEEALRHFFSLRDQYRTQHADLPETAAIPSVRAETVEAGTTGRTTDPGRRCIFCGRSQHEVQTMLAGPGGRICSGCVEVCVRTLAESEQAWR